MRQCAAYNQQLFVPHTLRVVAVVVLGWRSSGPWRAARDRMAALAANA